MSEEENKTKKHESVDDVINEIDLADESDSPKEKGDSRFHKYLDWYKSNKKKSIPATVLILLVLIAAVPWSRYHAAGLVLKNNLTMHITDSTANTPVSGANVKVGSIIGITDASGKVTLHNIKVGNTTVLVTKKYYQDRKFNTLVPIRKQKTTTNILFVATGRQTKITVTNLINHSKLEGVDIKIAGTTSKTDKTGSATVVLPVGTSVEKATLSLSGYNAKTFDVKADNNKIVENNLKMTPVGKVYFLSKLSGKIDVVKTNLDGTGRQTVLAGTGKEEEGGTVLLASRDWKYLALLSRREGIATKLYLLDTSTDSLKTMDGAVDVTVNPIGWSGHSFIYTVDRQNIANWKPNKQGLKSYNATNDKITLLAQVGGSGVDQYNWLTQTIGDVRVYNDEVIYELGWSGGYHNWSDINSKQVTLNSINNDGSNSKTIKSFDIDVDSDGVVFYASANTRVYKPGNLYIYFANLSGQHYYNYNYESKQVKEDISITDEKFWGTSYPTYLQSPKGDETFWNESRDGKNTLLLGDEDGENGKTIAILSDYQAYGWYSDDYLLVSKNNSELYIMTRSGDKNIQPIKITDYHKPARNFDGYGGGYGGI